VRHAQRRGRGPSSSTRLRERRCSQSERREAPRAVGSRRLRATRPDQKSRAVSSTRLHERRCSQSERREAPRAVGSRRLRATPPAQRPRAFEQHEATREARFTERAVRGSRQP